MGDDPATWGSAAPERWRVRRFATIDSTNQWMLDEARRDAPAGLVAVADHQVAGRGRRGRAWEDEPGASLLVSVLLRPGLPPDRVHLVTMAAGVAIAEAVEATSGVVASLKWPNDLVVADRKLAGLLAEVDLPRAGAPPAVVVGIGCNVAQTSFPGDLAITATSCALEAARSGRSAVVTRDALLDAFLARLRERLGALTDVPRAYRDRLGTLGRRVRVMLGEPVLGDADLEGAAIAVDGDGRLVVEPVGGGPAVTVAVGDVVHLRHEEPGGPRSEASRDPGAMD